MSASAVGRIHLNLRAVNGLFGRSCHFAEAILRENYQVRVSPLLISEVKHPSGNYLMCSGLVKYVLLYQKDTIIQESGAVRTLVPFVINV